LTEPTDITCHMTVKKYNNNSIFTHVSFAPERFLKNNRNLVRLRMGTSRHMSDLNYMKNLKELILAREEISPTVMKRVLAIKTLEKLELSGTFCSL
jgi:hypothetical protein